MILFFLSISFLLYRFDRLFENPEHPHFTPFVVCKDNKGIPFFSESQQKEASKKFDRERDIE